MQNNGADIVCLRSAVCAGLRNILQVNAEYCLSALCSFCLCLKYLSGECRILAQILSVRALLFALILETSWKRVSTESFWIKQEILNTKSAPQHIYDGYQGVGMVGPFFSWWDHVLTRDCVIFSSRPSWFTAYWWQATPIPWYLLISYTSQIIFWQKWCWQG